MYQLSLSPVNDGNRPYIPSCSCNELIFLLPGSDLTEVQEYVSGMENWYLFTHFMVDRWDDDRDHELNDSIR